MLRDNYEITIFLLGGLLSIVGFFLPFTLASSIYFIVGMFLMIQLYMHKSKNLQFKFEYWSIFPFVVFALITYLVKNPLLEFTFGYLALFFLAWIGVTIATYVPEQNKIKQSRQVAIEYIKEETIALPGYDPISFEEALEKAKTKFKVNLTQLYAKRFEQLRADLLKAQQNNKSTSALEQKIAELENYISCQTQQLSSHQQSMEQLKAQFQMEQEKAARAEEERMAALKEKEAINKENKELAKENQSLNLNIKKLSKAKDLTEKELAELKKQDQIASELFGFDGETVIFNKDIRKALEEGIRQANSEIAIVSPFIFNKATMGSRVFKETLAELFKKAIQRNVKIKIVYGMGKNSFMSNEEDYTMVKTEQTLKKLRKFLSPFDCNLFTKKGNVHSKVLIIDKRYLMTSSFNFLSFDGSYVEDTRGETATISGNQEKINTLYAKYFDF